MSAKFHRVMKNIKKHIISLNVKTFPFQELCQYKIKFQLANKITNNTAILAI